MPEPPVAQPVIRPPQFRLRTLLIVVTLSACVFAMTQWLTPIGWIAFVLLVACIALHVAGNAIGTRLRRIGDRPPDFTPSQVAAGLPQPHQFAPVTRLGQRHSLGWSIILATVLGVLLGGTGGGVWTWISSRGPAGPLPIAIGVLAFAVLGGLAAFAAVAFTQVLLGAIWQALYPPPVSELPSQPDR